MSETFKNSADFSFESPEKAKLGSVSCDRLTRTRVLLADSDSITIRLLEQHFQQQEFLVSVAHTGDAAVELCQKKSFDIVIADLTLPGLSRLDFFALLKSRDISSEVILISSQAGIEVVVEAMRNGAADFLLKPIRLPLLQEAVGRAFEKRRQKVETRLGGTRLSQPQYVTLSTTESPRMKEILRLVEKVAKSNSTILITGDSGVGKEVIARTIHQESLRCNSPFIDISCAAIPETLLESELFGYEKGSFTGADSSKRGLFELATGGTLFLDEIGEIGSLLQIKLLRVIETRSFYRVGGTKQITVDVRILAATNKDLKQAVEEGKFRKDLYYRLNTINLEVPSLRERVDDIPVLVERFLGEFDCTRQRRFSEAALEVLKQYPWPGNVRELRNMIERALLVSPHMLIDVEDLPQDILTYTPPAPKAQEAPPPLTASLIEMEKRQIAAILQRTCWHRGKAAELLEISPKTLYRKIKQYELDKMNEMF